ncbi:hypothetical protein ABIB40_002787 [Pedobacter sp. UYP30]|uniref:hypothetical protein n=1 Tax=Pedobacter sp. UYP30 TaxID=1756400 RepID=UPI0033992CE6
MAKQLFLFFFLLFTGFLVGGQVKIHSHNDYTHQKPFYDAVKNKAFSIEADVFVVGDALFVAHSRSGIKAGNTLEKMYLKPIEALSKTDEFYSFQLMIDVKDKWELTYPTLLKKLKPYQHLFLTGNKKTIIVISGNRPASSTFHNYPVFINFDGLPNVVYAKKDLERVTMISDNFANYSKWKGEGEISAIDKTNLATLINNAHKIGKPFRFWGAPDTKACWKLLHSLGADIINTDKVLEASNFFKI